MSISFQLEMANTHTLRLLVAELRVQESSSSGPVLFTVSVSGKKSTRGASREAERVFRLSLKYKQKNSTVEVLKVNDNTRTGTEKQNIVNAAHVLECNRSEFNNIRGLYGSSRGSSRAISRGCG